MMSEERTLGVRSLAKSFRNAFRGIVFCVKNERNMRIHLSAAAYVLVFSPFFHLSAAEYALLLTVICMVLSAETVNTAIEAAINLQTQWYDNLARIGKDVAAGAVLICAVFAVAVGLVLFLRPPVLLAIVCFLIGNPLWGVLFLLTLPADILFIIGRPGAGRRQSSLGGKPGRRTRV